MIWTPAIVQRLVLDMAGQLLQNPHAGVLSTPAPGIDLQHDLGIDSLRRMELAARLNEFFGLLHTSTNNYLLAGTTLDHWTGCILRARQEADDWLTFRTSGTGGAATPNRHRLSSLLAEARFLADLLPVPDLIVSTVATQHIYGFLFTVLLPAVWDRPLRLLADVPAADLTDNTLLIGTPFTWEFIRATYLATPSAAGQVRYRGVSSTAPMPPALYTQLTAAGVHLTEIYGSSDTGGVAYRTAPDAPFTLFPYVSLAAAQAGAPTTMSRTDTGEAFVIPDRLERLSARTVRVLGRLDEAVQIAGVNVYPSHSQKVIASCPLVAECDVYAKAESGVSQLYGAVRLRALTDANREACLRWIRERLSPPEVPAHLYVY